MLALRHRSASGRLDQLWEFCAVRGVVEVVFRLAASEPIAVTVKVCHPDRPVLLAHPIMRLDGESWRILPAIFIPAVSVSRDRDRSRYVPRDCSARAGGLRDAVPCDLHTAIGSSHIVLTNAPADIDAEMEALGT